MAFTANQLHAQVNGVGSGLRASPESVQPKTFASGSITLAALTPVAFNTSTSQWVIFASGGANGTGTIKGFVWPDPVVLAAGGEVLGQVLMTGRIHLNDIPIVTGYTLAQLKTAIIASAVRNQGIIVEGMTGFY